MTAPAVHRWIFDDLDDEEYTVPINPNKMGPLFGERAFTTRVTTAIDGQTLIFEGRTPPTPWSFSGVILNKDHHDALHHWTYEKGRIQITDHYDRTIICVLQSFKPEPKRARSYYWRHEYSISGLVIAVDDTNAILAPG